MAHDLETAVSPAYSAHRTTQTIHSFHLTVKICHLETVINALSQNLYRRIPLAEGGSELLVSPSQSRGGGDDDGTIPAGHHFHPLGDGHDDQIHHPTSHT